MYRFLIYTCLILLFVGCSSVGAPGKAKVKKNTKVKVTDTLKVSSEEFTQRFSDTATIALPAINTQEMEDDVPKKIKNDSKKDQSKNNVNNYLKEAINKFEEGKEQDKSCEMFKSIVETYIQSDSVYYEAKYYTAECEITRNEIEKAKKILDVLYPDVNVPSEIKERVIVRLGQIYCLLNNPSLAQKYFNELKRMNPNSIYLKVANCNFSK